MFEISLFLITITFDLHSSSLSPTQKLFSVYEKNMLLNVWLATSRRLTSFNTNLTQPSYSVALTFNLTFDIHIQPCCHFTKIKHQRILCFPTNLLFRERDRVARSLTTFLNCCGLPELYLASTKTAGSMIQQPSLICLWFSNKGFQKSIFSFTATSKSFIIDF